MNKQAIIMKKSFLLFLLAFVPAWAIAIEVEINGINYDITKKTKTAEVIKRKPEYSDVVVIPPSVTYEEIEYPVTSIGGSAFFGCRGLTSITIPNSVNSIGESAFGYCSGLTSVTIPNSVTSIGNSAFSGCGSLKSIIIPNSVSSIGNMAFLGCTRLISVTIPNSVTSIGNSAFGYCSGLTSVTIPNSVTSIGNSAFSGCSGLTSVTIPNSVTSIGENAFTGCIGLTSLTIPSSVNSIGSCAFYGCSGLTKVTIGSGIKYILSEAFANCGELTDVYCYAENVPSTNSDVFSNSYLEYATLYVPEVSISKYRAASPWNGFKEIKALSGETPETNQCAKPTITYENGKLKFGCETEGVEFVSEITDTDIKKHFETEVSLTATYHISVYAAKTGYDNSEVATATLCWIDVEPKKEGISDGVAQVKAMPILIESADGVLTVKGIEDDELVSVYNTDGMLESQDKSYDGVATIRTSLKSGSIAVLKIGQKAVKVLMK